MNPTVETESAMQARRFSNQNPIGRVVMVKTKDPNSSTFFHAMVVEKKAYDRRGVPVVKLEGLSWPMPLMWVRPMQWMVS